MKAGLNIYSIRKNIATEEDFLATAHKLKEMGYSYLQFSGAPFNPQLIRRMTQETGLPVYLTHMPKERILEDADRLMEEHEVFGCKNIGLGMMPVEAIYEEKTCKETVEKLDRIGEKMKKNGFKFFYHHHNFEFLKHNGQTVFDYMLNNSTNINFTIDTYWLQYGGVSILEYLEKTKGRIECVHLKDYTTLHRINENNSHKFEPTICPVGDGVINFQAVVKAALESGAKYFFVEQDNAASMPDPLGQVERSIQYIQKEL